MNNRSTGSPAGSSLVEQKAYLQEEAAPIVWKLLWQLLGQLNHDQLDQVCGAPLGDCVHCLAPSR